MQEVILVIHLILTISLVVMVLLQRSTGGALGIGGGQGGMMSGRSAATLLTRITTFLAVGFFVTSLGLAVIAKQQSEDISVFDVDKKVIEQNIPTVTEDKAPVIPDSE
ncbi:MAG: preprotein translocase subunit SecG [Emcibacter sp.]|nr:preprotein translocase subunit SecG [Emcibacter sp.]